jgi:hypothetical protein
VTAPTLTPTLSREERERERTRDLLAKSNFNAPPQQFVAQRRHRNSRIEMALAGEEQPLAEASRQVRLQRSDRVGIDALPFPRSCGETVDLADVARRRDDEGAVAHHPWDPRSPPIQRFRAALDHRGRSALALAERRQHAAGEPGRIAAQLRRALEDRDLGAALDQRRRRREASDAGADDCDAHRYSAAFTYSAPPASKNSFDLASIPAIATASCRRSRVICIEQNFGPHIEQKCATLWASFGKVSS